VVHIVTIVIDGWSWVQILVEKKVFLLLEAG